MKTIVKVTLGLIYVIGIYYLSLPTPVYPDLTSSTLSDEPGDTWQHLDQKAFYTQKERYEVISEFKNNFSLKLSSFTIPPLKLNYRPEETTQFVREQVPSNYLEEIVYPLRESLFINGWEPQNSPEWQTVPYLNRPRIEKYNQYYYAKITLRLVESPIWARLLVWSLIFPASYFVLISIKKNFAKND